MPNASDVIGRDECSCCERSRADVQLSYERDDRTGICSVCHNCSFNCFNELIEI